MSQRNDDDRDFGNLMWAFGTLANALGGGHGSDRGQSFPQSDADDFSKGLRFVPGEVTMARRQGQKVTFHQPCSNQCCWYWQFPDESRTYYWERWNFEQIAQANGKDLEAAKDAGTCPRCGNTHTSGEHIEKP